MSESIETYTPKTVDEFLQHIAKEQHVSDLNRHRSPIVYRGVSKCEYKLQTNLQRMEGEYGEREYHLLRNYRKYSLIEDNLSETSLWKLMAIAQHHGLPTRLLDWTFSPFVALHFATSELKNYDSDGALYCVDYTKIHNNKHIPKWAKFELEFSNAKMFSFHMLEKIVKHSLEEALDNAELRGNQDEINRYKHKGSIQTQLRAFDRLKAYRADEDKNFLLFFEPPSLDSRIVNQYALFSIASSPQCDINEYLFKFYPDAISKIIIEKKLKWPLRNRLDQYNITERILFPGHDGLATYLKRHYSPAPS